MSGSDLFVCLSWASSGYKLAVLCLAAVAAGAASYCAWRWSEVERY